jgi:hypothetical protein
VLSGYCSLKKILLGGVASRQKLAQQVYRLLHSMKFTISTANYDAAVDRTGAGGPKRGWIAGL